MNKPIREIETKTHWFVKHGMSGTRIYKTWNNMRSRCNNPKATKYYLYGGKGIEVCKEWKESFESFYYWSMENGYQENLSIDRIDGEEDYSPSNCRWATNKEQANNTTQNHYLTFKGETHNVTQWAELIGVTPKCLSTRIERGWTVERALKTSTINIENFGNFIKERKKVKNV